MPTKFFSKLSQNFIVLLKDDEYYDITIEVGEDPNVKIFRAHMNILCYRSPYLRRILASNNNRNNNTNDLVHIRFPNISPEIFQIILEYIYGGILSLDENDTSDFLKVLAAADELSLQELIDHLQKYLIENKSEWIEQNFGLTQQIISQSNNLLVLQEYCTNLMAQYPERIFESFDFTLLSETSLISLIKRDDLQMKEIEVWEYVIKWGLAQNPTLISDPRTWSDDDFKTMKNTLQQCLPLIRFFSLTSGIITQKIRPYRKLLDQQLYENLIDSYMDPDSNPIENILLPRKNIKFDIDSKIVNLNIISTVSRWIDEVDVNYEFSHFRELYFPYEFKLLLRGSRNGFTPKKFHDFCDGKPYTVTFIKVRGTEEIIGGYNPLIWESSRVWGETEDSFIFSFKNRDAVISSVKNPNYAIDYSTICGPQFGYDLTICSTDKLVNYSKIFCKQHFYEKKIRDTEDEFLIEDYEVFQLI
ncbi:hypothetical protein RirG_230020 [Rhizophagus irregularis DAOM 197198w]|uniref:Serine-enriched protein n=1 Tax=Rhizophagus irregularis (strain DAOM 197198w) TaxID=1432141 RepID=A0A015ICP5_RHIIW|nr:hypothetical protein RirG_230020 [Rhizophagus irregularis DAOM 197198w]